MIKKNSFYLLFGFFVTIGIFMSHRYKSEVWGFYGHRLINRMAVYILPPEMLGFYKNNIEYIAEHSIDPDKRRYATKHEAARHYIDIDIWDKPPFGKVPRDFEEAIIWKAQLYGIRGRDTSYLTLNRVGDSISVSKGNVFLSGMKFPSFLRFWKKQIKPLYYEDIWTIASYDLDDVFHTTAFTTYFDKVLIEDHFSEHGICPFNLEDFMGKLTRAFEVKDYEKILRFSAEFGHYIADAHVPLHTTTNYNGQLTDQVGIHAFWESRIPELFAEREYDFFVGKAEYIENPKDYFWRVIIDSHILLDSVLRIEKRLSLTYPRDQQFCYDERLGITNRIQCPEYALAYSKAMGSMVEDRMRAAIHAIGSCIYTCWVNAGQPILQNAPTIVFKEVDENYTPDPNIKTRAHDND